MSESTRDVVVTTDKGGAFVQEMRLGPHTMVADEPISLGGDDEGPSPYDLLLGALGACTSMTIKMYADRKKWPLETVTVRLRHEKIYASDCTDCESKDGKIDKIHRVLSFRGDITDDMRKRLVEIADRCPVHKTLTGEVKISTVVDEGSS